MASLSLNSGNTWPVRQGKDSPYNHGNNRSRLNKKTEKTKSHKNHLNVSYLPPSWSDRCPEPPCTWVRCGRREPRPGSGKGSCFSHLVPSVSGNKGGNQDFSSWVSNSDPTLLLLGDTGTIKLFNHVFENNWRRKPLCFVPSKPSCHKAMTSSGSMKQHERPGSHMVQPAANHASLGHTVEQLAVVILQWLVITPEEITKYGPHILPVCTNGKTPSVSILTQPKVPSNQMLWLPLVRQENKTRQSNW